MIDTLLEKNWIPDFIRGQIRRLNQRRLKSEAQKHANGYKAELAKELKSSPIAIETIAANDHYRSALIFEMFAKHLKYSCCYWPNEVSNLDQAESSMLELTVKGQNYIGQTILELGCGWGAISLWMAEQYQTQRFFRIEFKRSKKIYRNDRCSTRLVNLQVQTCDMNSLKRTKL